MHIATKAGWKDRVSDRDFFDGWREQKPDDRLLFLEDCIGYMYLDFVEHGEGARPSVFPRSRVSPSSRLLYSPAACATLCAAPTCPLPPRRPPEPRAARRRSAPARAGRAARRSSLAGTQ